MDKSTYALKLQCDSLSGDCTEIYVVNSGDIVPGQMPACPKCKSNIGISIIDVLEPQEEEPADAEPYVEDCYYCDALVFHDTPSPEGFKADCGTCPREEDTDVS